MESTPNELAMIQWNRRLNNVKMKKNNNIEIENYGDDYYLQMLNIVEVLFRLVIDSEQYLKNGEASFYGTVMTYKFVIGEIQIPVFISVDTVCTTINFGQYSNPLFSTVMIKDSDFEINEGNSYTGENMIIIQDGEYSSAAPSPALADALIKSTKYLKNDKYNRFIVYDNPDTKHDLHMYKNIVQDMITEFIFWRYTE